MIGVFQIGGQKFMALNGGPHTMLKMDTLDIAQLERACAGTAS
jgi:hypothetical protein